MERIILILALLICIVLGSCKKNEDDTSAYVPEVTTIPYTNLLPTTVVTGGVVTSDGGSEVTSRGVCWGTQNPPDITANTKPQGKGLGNFTSELSNLNPSTNYYLRAYATNKFGTGYGSVISFKTPDPMVTNSTPITDIDGNTYQTIKLGNQYWMSENLKTSRYRNGDPIPTGLSNSDWAITVDGAYAFYDNDPANDDVYGKLYNWYATVDTRGLCPAGWHVATDDDWTELSNHIMSYNYIYSEVGGTLKMTGTSLWELPNTGATNSSGFSAKPGGWMENVNNYNSTAKGYAATFWTSTEFSSETAFIRNLRNNSGELWRFNNNIKKQFGASIRCVKD